MYLFCDNKYCKYHDPKINRCRESNHDCPYQKELREKENKIDATETVSTTDIPSRDTLLGDNFIAVGIKTPQASTIQIDKCEKIILRQSGIDVKFELDNDDIRKFKQMYINGIGFVRSEAFCEELEDRLPKDIETSVMEIILDLLEDWKR